MSNEADFRMKSTRKLRVSPQCAHTALQLNGELVAIVTRDSDDVLSSSSLKFNSPDNWLLLATPTASCGSAAWCGSAHLRFQLSSCSAHTNPASRAAPSRGTGGVGSVCPAREDDLSKFELGALQIKAQQIRLLRVQEGAHARAEHVCLQARGSASSQHVSLSVGGDVDSASSPAPFLPQARAQRSLLRKVVGLVLSHFAWGHTLRAVLAALVATRRVAHDTSRNRRLLLSSLKITCQVVLVHLDGFLKYASSVAVKRITSPYSMHRKKPCVSLSDVKRESQAEECRHFLKAGKGKETD
ncbi:uncharacterized protein [Vicugna pacos]|uniref:Uncharacterized protein n=1 Tax=Vicugna pacos TaxID=30538 RepID=A0ABM5D294_VICPA